MHSTSTQDLSISQVFGLAFIEAKRSNCTRAGRLGSNSRRNRNIGLYHVLDTHARSHRRNNRDVSTRARASLNWSRTTFNKDCRRDLFLQIWERLRAFHASDPSAPVWPSSWPGVPVRLAYRVSGLFLPSAPEAHTSTFFIVGNSVRSTFHRRRFNRCLHQHLHILSFLMGKITLIFSCDRCPFASFSGSSSRLRL